MATLHKEPKIHPHIYSGSSDQLRPHGGSWYDCRVSFHDGYEHHQSHGKPFFVSPAKPIDLLMGGLDFLEDKLVPADQRINVYPTNHTNTYEVNLSEWWLDPIRFTFLTCWMRDWNGNLDQMLAAGKYFGASPKAVRHFLAGNVFYQLGRYDGWVISMGDSYSPFTLDALPPFITLEEKLKDKPGPTKDVSVVHHPGFTIRPKKLAQK